MDYPLLFVTGCITLLIRRKREVVLYLLVSVLLKNGLLIFADHFLLFVIYFYT